MYLSRKCPQMNVIRPYWWYPDKSTFVQVMAWCHQAASHYPSQCWPRSISPHSVTRPRVNTGWDNDLMPDSTKPLPLPIMNYKLLRLSATCFIEIVTIIPTLLFKKKNLKMLSAEWQPCFSGLNMSPNRHLLPASYITHITLYVIFATGKQVLSNLLFYL